MCHSLNMLPCQAPPSIRASLEGQESGEGYSVIGREEMGDFVREIIGWRFELLQRSLAVCVR